MTTQTSKKIYTIEEFMGLPLSAKRLELVEGELLEMPPTGDEHGVICLNIASELRAFARRHNLGKVWVTTGFVIDSTTPKPTVREPDVAFVISQRVPPTGKGAVPVPPDLVVEVTSPSDESAEITRKIQQYQKAGVPLIWQVYPDKQEVHIYRLSTNLQFETRNNQQELEGEALLPDFKLKVSAIFEE